MHSHQTDHHAPRALVARFAGPMLLAVVLASGFAMAEADVRTEFSAGTLRGPEVYAGEGFHSIGLVNQSADAVTFNVYRLHDGTSRATFEQTNDALLKALMTPDAPAAMKTFMDQADALSGTDVKAHSETDMYVDLEEGTYVVTASVESNGDEPVAPAYTSFLVTEGGDQGTAPEVDHVAHLSDFAFDFPATVAAGENLWEISNTGDQPHIAAFFKLLPGKTAADLAAVLSGGMDENQAPPFDTTTDVSVEALTPGATAYVPLDFSTGTWVAVCFVPDMNNPSMAHYMEGMIEEFMVN